MEGDIDPSKGGNKSKNIVSVLKPLHQKQGRKKSGNPKVNGESLEIRSLDNCYIAGTEIK